MGVLGRQFARQEVQPIMSDLERRGAMAWRSRLVGEPGSRKPTGGTSSLPQCSSVSPRPHFGQTLLRIPWGTSCGSLTVADLKGGGT